MRAFQARSKRPDLMRAQTVRTARLSWMHHRTPVATSSPIRGVYVSGLKDLTGFYREAAYISRAMSPRCASKPSVPGRLSAL